MKTCTVVSKGRCSNQVFHLKQFCLSWVPFPDKRNSWHGTSSLTRPFGFVRSCLKITVAFCETFRSFHLNSFLCKCWCQRCSAEVGAMIPCGSRRPWFPEPRPSSPCRPRGGAAAVRGAERLPAQEGSAFLRLIVETRWGPTSAHLAQWEQVPVWTRAVTYKGIQGLHWYFY